MKRKNKKIKCSYPKCNKDAEVTLGMNDPDAERIPYCNECAEKVRMNTMMGMRGLFRENEKI